MGEKRKAPPRGGESAAKRKLSESTLKKRDTTPAKRKASATPTIPPSPEPEKNVLPTQIKDGDPLPTLAKPQPSTLSLEEYQSYAASAVLATALQRSRIKWLNDCVFEKYWTKPSKKKSQPQPPQNPPRESMSKLGPCSIVIEPHHFEAVLFTVRNPQAQQSIQNAPPQRPIVQYAPPNNFHQYQPPPGQPRQLYSPNPHASPIATPPPDQQPPLQNRFEPPLHSNPPPPVAQPARQPRAEGPAPSPQNRIPQNQPPTHHPQNYPAKHEPMQHPPSKPPPEPSQPVKTSPDPVIQMLATRAASNPELKALMRIVASSKANQAQLRTFQAHIDELNAILASRRQNDKNIPPYLKPDQQGRSFTPGAPQPPSSTPTPTPAAPAQPHPSHPVHPNGPNISSQTALARASPSAHSAYPNQLPPQPIRSKPIPQPQLHNTYFHQHTPSRPPVAPPKPDPKAVVFEFLTTSPAGSSSSHASTGDRYLFPKNTILDYFPGGTTVIASFIVIKKIDTSAPPPDSFAGKTSGKAKSKKSEVASATGTPTPTDTSNQNPTPAPDQGTPEPATNPPQSDRPTLTTTGPETQPSTATTTEIKPSPPKPKIKEYYQPVTMRLHANNPRTLEPLARVVNPPAEVRQYMNDIMDRMERADIEYLALRLPHEGFGQNGPSDEAGQTVSERPSQPQQQQQSRGARSKSKGRGEKGVDSGAENGVVVKQETGGAGNRGVLLGDMGSVEDMQFEEELKEFYDMPSGIVPLRRRVF
ncbi:hypothetical protein ACJ73_02965 [Blastomyces percursus]|uniref:SWR1-complex protein 3 domain-containing protein n=1 Tax=Blastomyces percursus TaxID=1658174 RepID=A0A1J9QC62_9EURO|nr:hypothetical protein ACJ73_02965 [Blastomyces percursus]